MVSQQRIASYVVLHQVPQHGHLKGQLEPNQNIFSEKLDKEESVLCWVLQKQALRWRSICKWFLKEIIPEQSNKKWGSKAENGILGKVLWS